MSSNLSRIVAALRRAGDKRLSAEEIYQAEIFATKESLMVALSTYSMQHKYLLREKDQKTGRFMYWVNPVEKLPDYVPEEVERMERPKKPAPIRPEPLRRMPVAPTRPAAKPAPSVPMTPPKAAPPVRPDVSSMIVRPFAPPKTEEENTMPEQSEKLIDMLKPGRQPESETDKATSRAVGYGDVLADLRAKRALIDGAIVAMEKLAALSA